MTGRSSRWDCKLHSINFINILVIITRNVQKIFEKLHINCKILR